MRRRPPDHTRAALAALERALAGRRDHASWCGVNALQTPFGVRIDFRDALTSEQRLLAFFGRREQNWQPTVAAVLEKIEHWRTE